MTAASGVLDTSAVIQLGRIDAAALPAQPVITAVTLAELSVGPLVAADEAERALRLTHLQLAESDFEVLPFGADAARAYGRIAAGLRRGGRTGRARSLDVMIAATAVANGLAVFTANPRDFDGIAELEVFTVGPT